MTKGAEAWHQEGLAHYQSGAYAEAIEAFAKARTVYHETHDPAAAAEVLNNQGVAYRMLKEWTKAEAAFAEAQAEFHQLGDPIREAQALANLGSLALSRNQTGPAVAHLKGAAAIFQAEGDGLRESDTRRALSLAHFKQRRLLNALTAYEAALSCLPHPSPWQRFLRWLFGLPTRLLTGK